MKHFTLWKSLDYIRPFLAKAMTKPASHCSFGLTKTFLLLCAMVVGSNVWAETVTIASFNMSGGTPDGWSCNADKQSTTYYKMYKDKTIVSPSISFSNYTNIKIKIKARKLGGPSDAQKVISVYQGATSNVLTSYTGPANTTLTYSSELSMTPSDGSITVACLAASTDKGCGISEVIITGEEYSSDPTSNASFANVTPSMDIKDGYTFSQAVTTAPGYTGTITYSITANTAGATINESTGQVTVSKAGSVTVKANAAAVSGSFSASSATYTLTVNDTRTATVTEIVTTGLVNKEIQNGAAAGKLIANVTAGDSNVDGATVSWTSSNPAIATIDEEGNITLLMKGSTIITATYDGTLAYKPSSDTYELMVTNSAIVTINLSNTLFGCNTGNIAAEQNATVENVSVTTGCTSSASSKTYYASDHVRFYADSYLILDAPSGYVITNIVLNRYNSDTWNPNKVSVDDGELSGSDPLQWTGFASSVEFSYSGQCRTSSIDVTLAPTTVSVTISANKEWITYTSKHALDFSEDITGLEGAYTITGHTSEATTLTATKMTGTVKAGTGLLLHAAAVDTENAQVIAIPVAASGDEQTDNMLVGVTTATTVNPTDGAGNTNLGLKNGSFVPYSTAGNLAAGKAYLQIPTADMPASGAKLTIIFDDGETTSIDLNAIDNLNTNGQMYNLAGQKVSKSYKGIVIMNGRKFINK